MISAPLRIIGLNNRNLATFEVDLEVTEKLTKKCHKRERHPQRRRPCPDQASGVNAVLIGEALMRAQNGANGSLLAEPR